MVANAGGTDAKMERLLNLVIALLGTKKFLTKAQIISLLPGYEGASEAQDRMFERDKDDLRKIGIEIEVKQLDPLFDDEVGYRIKRDQYQIQFPELTPEEGLLASAALTLVSTLRAGVDFAPAYLKVSALIPAGPNPMDRIVTSLSETQVLKTPAFSKLLSAIRERALVSFDYVRDSDSVLTRRNVDPRQLLLKDEEWVLRGWDLDRSAFRSFIVENITSEVTTGDTFRAERVEEVFPDEGKDDAKVEIETIAPADLESHLLSEGGRILESDGSFIKVRFRTYNQDRLLRLLIALDPAITVSGPSESAIAWDAMKKRLRDAI